MMGEKKKKNSGDGGGGANQEPICWAYSQVSYNNSDKKQPDRKEPKPLSKEA